MVSTAYMAVVPQVEVHMATVHHDGAGRRGGRRETRATPQEQAAAGICKAASALKEDQSGTMLASHQTTLSIQASTNALAPKSASSLSSLSADDSSHASLWPSAKKVCASNPPEADKNKCVVSDVSSSAEAYRSLWLSVRNANQRVGSLASNRGSSPSPHNSGVEKTEPPVATQHYKSLWPSLERIKSSTSSVTEIASGGLTPSDTQSLSSSRISSSYASFWPRGKMLLEVSDGRQERGRGNGSEISVQSRNILSNADFLSEGSSSCWVPNPCPLRWRKQDWETVTKINDLYIEPVHADVVIYFLLSEWCQNHFGNTFLLTFVIHFPHSHTIFWIQILTIFAIFYVLFNHS